jgi:hypothetical protein
MFVVNCHPHPTAMMAGYGAREGGGWGPGRRIRLIGLRVFVGLGVGGWMGEMVEGLAAVGRAARVAALRFDP